MFVFCVAKPCRCLLLIITRTHFFCVRIDKSKNKNKAINIKRKYAVKPVKANNMLSLILLFYSHIFLEFKSTMGAIERDIHTPSNRKKPVPFSKTTVQNRFFPFFLITKVRMSGVDKVGMR